MQGREKERAASAIKAESKKGYQWGRPVMVGTFLTEDSSVAMVSKYQPLKRHRKR